MKKKSDKVDIGYVDSIRDFGKLTDKEKIKIIRNYMKEEHDMLFSKKTKKVVEEVKKDKVSSKDIKRGVREAFKKAQQRKSKETKESKVKGSKENKANKGEKEMKSNKFVTGLKSLLHNINPVTWFKAVKSFFTKTKDKYEPTELVGTPFQQWVFKLKTNGLESLLKRKSACTSS
jgi:hypothetical protein